MRNLAILPFLGLFLCGLSLSQQRAQSELYTRVEGDRVEAAVRVVIAPRYHLYHDELGDYPGLPTILEGIGEEVEWEAWRLPEPSTGYDKNFETFYAKHEGTIVIHGSGLFLGDDPAAIRVRISGQTCDDKGCVPYEEDLDTKGIGPDELFAAASLDAPSKPEGRTGSLVFSAAPEAKAASPEQWPSFDAGRKADIRARIEEDGQRAQLILEVGLAEGYHLYHGPTLEDIAPGGAVALPTTIEISGTGVAWEAPRFPEPDLSPGMSTSFDDIEVKTHHGRFTILVPGKVTGEVSAAQVKVAGQTCDDLGCLDYRQEATAAVLKVASVSEPAAASGSTSQAGSGSSDRQDPPASGSPSEKPLLNFLLEAVMWGVITLLMPCTYPMIPITISFFTKQAIARKGKVLDLSLAYGGGIVLVFILIGALVGAPIQALANHPIFNLLIATVFVVFALSLFGMFILQPPAFLLRAAGKASMTGGLLGVFLMGVTLVVTSFTCTAPFVGTLLARGGDQGLLRVILGMGVFGLTMATPFVFLSLFPSRAQKMPGAGSWMNTLKVFLGFVELAAALKFVSTADLAYQWGFLSKEVFLILWAGIFAVAAMYLFGKINLKGEESGAVSAGRMVAGTLTFLFALYCAFLTFGFKMDPLMTAFAPPYSTAPVLKSASTGGGDHAAESWAQVVDDFDGAVARARAEQKLLLVNFTGFN